MLTENKRTEKFWNDALHVILCILTIYFIIWAFTNSWPHKTSTYNSYVLQACRWLQGHLDLGYKYEYLEIAEYGGKYFISFPPIPSVLVLPLCLIFGVNAPDGVVSVVMSLIGAIYALKLMWHIGRRGSSAVFWTLFVTIGSNFLHVGYCADVWYLAQTCSFAFTMMAIFYANTKDIKNGWLSFFFLALAFGCRPLQIVYLPLIVYLVWLKLKSNEFKLLQAIKNYWWWVLPALCIGCFLMWLNYARFNNPLQFGHDYLPEFAIEKENGQFDISYLFTNWVRLWRLPSIKNGRIAFNKFDGEAFWLFSPIFIAFVGFCVKNFKKVLEDSLVLIIILSILLHFVALCCHATMGGWQFGNRYTIDALPALFLGLSALMENEKSNLTTLASPLFLWGLTINLVGTIALINRWI